MTITPTPQPLLDFEDAELEPPEAQLQRRLGLRPHNFKGSGDKAHPDSAPCPPWCWIRQVPGAAHEVDPHHPYEAEHTMEPAPKVAASLYQGDFGHSPDRVIRAATLEPRLEQRGDAVPTIPVGFRRFDGRGQVMDADYLRLSLDDAQELVTA